MLLARKPPTTYNKLVTGQGKQANGALLVKIAAGTINFKT